MIFTNLNIFISIIFIIFCIIIFLVVYKNYFEYKKTGSTYRFLSVIFLILSFFVLSIAIFGIKVFKTENNSYLGTNVVFVLDVSKSMKALDFSNNNETYSRLSAAKKFISDFVIKNPGNRYALTVFAGDAERVLPFTNDANLFLTILSGVDENNVTIQGTNLKEAINSGLRNFTKDDTFGLMVVLTDGDDENKINMTDFENFKNKKDIKSVVVGVGTTKGAYIPIGNDPFGDVIYKTYNGQKVITKLSDTSLKELAKILNGDYYNLDDIGRIDKIGSTLSSISKKIFYSKSENFVDMTRLFVYISFVFFIIYLLFLIKYDKRKK
nr:VWA domain-containing protein [Candidatus Gracilibacteria bacterium]